MFFKKKKRETIDSIMSPIEMEKLRKEREQTRFNDCKKALDNIQNYHLNVSFDDALKFIDFLGTDNYNFKATEHIECGFTHRFIEITRKQSKEANYGR